MLQNLEPLVSGLFRIQHTMGIFRSLGVPSNQHAAVVAIGVGVAIVAGVAGIYIVQGQTPWGKKRHSKPLTPKEWHSFFDTDGRLLNGGGQIVGKVRRGGVAPEIRCEVWPFLLGVHELDTTERDRKKKKLERRRKYLRLRKQVEALSQQVDVLTQQEENLKLAEVERKQNGVNKGEAKGQGGEELGSGESLNSGEQSGLDSVTGGGSESGLDSKSERESGGENWTVDGKVAKPSNGHASDTQAGSKDFVADVSSKDSVTSDPSNIQSASSSSGSTVNSSAYQRANSKGSPISPEDVRTLDEFRTSARIIRLDAVRMNAAWIPYAPTQANCDFEKAAEMATSVGLENDEHLEPARRAHAARLVAILEAYAVYDKETGYCQGMSDLLSPFVALIEDDAEAFWCFQRFMRTAKYNFRLDEKGIRGQLDRLAAILEKGDPELYRHLAEIGAGDCIFAYRMVVVLFRRELSFEQTLSLWEVCWADALAAEQLKAVTEAAGTVGGTLDIPSGQKVPTTELLLYTIAAAVAQRRRKIIDECTAMDEVLKECNGMANNIDLWRTLQDARVLVQLCANS